MATPDNRTVIMASYASLFSLWAISQVYLLPVTFNLIATSTLVVFIGCHRSLRLRDKTHPNTGESETMTSQDAYKFPLAGSAVLFGMYLVFKIVPKEYVNLLILLYFSVMGLLTVAGTLDPLISSVLGEGRVVVGRKVDLPWLGEVDLSFTPSQLLSTALGAVVAAVYFQTRHWAINNVFGISFCVQGMERISIGSFKIGIILLCGLFVYDIFWVFGTEVMVSVAKNFDGPIKLLFPTKWGIPELDPPKKGEFSLLGLGDIVVPGIFLALLLRFDAVRGSARIEDHENARFAKPYFFSGILAYVAGLAVTVVSMYVFNAAQPALLYLVPAVLLTALATATYRKEIKDLWAYTEEEPESGDGLTSVEAKKKTS